MNYAFKTDVGIVRKNNEDIVWAGENSHKQLFVIACDGLGGLDGGEVASKIVLDTFVESFKKCDFKKISKTAFIQWFKSTLTNSRIAIANNLKKDSKLANMATTLTGSLINEKNIYTFNIGDSRTYFIKNQEVSLITEDHNVYQMLKKAQANEDTWKRYENKYNALTSYVNAYDQNELIFDVFVNTKSEADYVVACTDGFHSFVHESKLTAVYGSNLDEFADSMIKLAIDEKSNDNISLAVAGIKR